MSIKEYLLIVGEFLEKAEKNADMTEWIRLANALIDELKRKIEEVESLKGYK